MDQDGQNQFSQQGHNRSHAQSAEPAQSPDSSLTNPSDSEAAEHTDIQTLVQRSLTRIEETLSTDSARIDELNKEILDKVRANELLVKDGVEEKPALSFGNRASNFIARFGGSWPFVGIFSGTVVIWIIYNSISAMQAQFDPFPFIFLNLMLSCLAALQAPIILMSQNAQADRDRKAEQNDYSVNLKAEIELQLLHEKMDYLLTSQWKSLMEIQEIQIEMLDSIQGEHKRTSKS